MTTTTDSNTEAKSYLVTGCAGFIASQVAKQLLDRGDRIVGVDNMNDYYDVGLKQHRLEQLKHDRFCFAKLDIEDRVAVDAMFAEHRFDGILNLAARAGVRYSMENPHVYMTTNAMGNLNLLEAARRHGIRKFVLASTSSLYAGQPMPFSESLPVNTPISPYAASKKAAEVMAYTYHYLYGIDVSVCRYFTVYGPAGRPDMSIFRFIRWIDEGEPIQIFGDGNQSRDFTYVDDIAAGTIAALKEVGYEVINLGGGIEPVSLLEIISILERLLGKNAKMVNREFHKADMLKTSADISKAHRLLGWKPQVELERGLTNCVAWYQQNKPWSAQIVLPKG